MMSVLAKKTIKNKRGSVISPLIHMHWTEPFMVFAAEWSSRGPSPLVFMRPLPHNSGGPSTHGSTAFSLHQQQAHNSPHAKQPQVKLKRHFILICQLKVGYSGVEAYKHAETKQPPMCKFITTTTSYKPTNLRAGPATSPPVPVVTRTRHS